MEKKHVTVCQTDILHQWCLRPHLARQIMVLVMDCSQVEDGQASAQNGGTLEQGKERLLGHSHFYCHLVNTIHKGDATT